MTEKTLQNTENTSDVKADKSTAINNATTESTKIKDVKKDKCQPMAKVVIRRLPPSMTEEQFLEQVSPLPEYDYMYFVKADMSLGQYAFCRAYIDFVKSEDIFNFRDKFDNYVFVDAKGLEYAAVVEYAPFQRVPKKRANKKKDLKCGTIESDPYYISFLENLKNEAVESTNVQSKTEYSFQPDDLAHKKITTTPLLDFLKQRKQEKQRMRDEKREEKRRRDMERKRGKEEILVSKVMKNVEEKDKEKETIRENKENKDDKEKSSHKDLKNRNKKEDKYRDKINKDRESKVSSKSFKDRDDRNKERDAKFNKKHDEKKHLTKRDDRESHNKEDRLQSKEESSYKERKVEEKRGKSYEKMRQEKRRLAEAQKKQVSEPVECNHEDGVENEQDDCSTLKNNSNFKNKNKKSEDSSNVSEQLKIETDTLVDKSQVDQEIEALCKGLDQTLLKDKGESIKTNEKSSRITKRRSSLESGGENSSSNKSGSGSNSKAGGSDEGLRRHKSLDGGDEENLRKHEGTDKDKEEKKDPRSERRIKNKDRPAMEIYRPGMGRFSKQRIEREKVTDERVTPSQSPTPTSSGNSTGNSSKTKSEVRSMTFKRSVNRDAS